MFRSYNIGLFTEANGENNNKTTTNLIDSPKIKTSKLCCNIREENYWKICAQEIITLGKISKHFKIFLFHNNCYNI